MELAVELIVCTKNGQHWHSHFEFVNGNGDSTTEKLELKAIDQLISKINNGQMEGLLKKENLKYIGVLTSQSIN